MVPIWLDGLLVSLGAILALEGSRRETLAARRWFFTGLGSYLASQAIGSIFSWRGLFEHRFAFDLVQWATLLFLLGAMVAWAAALRSDPSKALGIATGSLILFLVPPVIAKLGLIGCTRCLALAPSGSHLSTVMAFVALIGLLAATKAASGERPLRLMLAGLAVFLAWYAWKGIVLWRPVTPDRMRFGPPSVPALAAFAIFFAAGVLFVLAARAAPERAGVFFVSIALALLVLSGVYNHGRNVLQCGIGSPYPRCLARDMPVSGSTAPLTRLSPIPYQTP